MEYHDDHEVPSAAPGTLLLDESPSSSTQGGEAGQAPAARVGADGPAADVAAGEDGGEVLRQDLQRLIDAVVGVQTDAAAVVDSMRGVAGVETPLLLRVARLHAATAAIRSIANTARARLEPRLATSQAVLLVGSDGQLTGILPAPGATEREEVPWRS